MSRSQSLVKRSTSNDHSQMCSAHSQSKSVMMKVLAIFFALACSLVFFLGGFKLNRSLYNIGNQSFIAQPTALLGIFSYSAGGKKRQYIRDTFIKDADERFCPLDEYVNQPFRGNKQKCRFPYTFIIGGGSKDRPTYHNDDAPLTLNYAMFRNEETSDCNYQSKGYGDHRNDCTFLNIKENMEWGKSPTYMKFASKIATEYGIDYIAKLDDDTYLSTELFGIFVDDELPPAPFNRRMYIGPPRPSRIKHHIYAAGEFYMLSSDLANHVGNELDAEYMKDLSMHIEDLDMGTYVHTNPRPIKYLNTNIFTFYHHACKTEKCFRDWHQQPIYSGLPKYKPLFQWDFYCRFINGKTSK